MVVNFPRHAAATFLVDSSEFAEFWNNGTQIVSATLSSFTSGQLLTTCATCG